MSDAEKYRIVSYMRVDLEDQIPDLMTLEDAHSEKSNLEGMQPDDIFTIESEDGSPVPNLWGDDLLQFSRLLHEIESTGALEEEGRVKLAKEMDLSLAEVDEIFNRARRSFTQALSGIV